MSSVEQLNALYDYLRTDCAYAPTSVVSHNPDLHHGRRVMARHAAAGHLLIYFNDGNGRDGSSRDYRGSEHQPQTARSPPQNEIYYQSIPI